MNLPPLHCLVPGRLWHATQPLRFGPITLTTRMTVLRLRDGSVWVHSPITPTPELQAAIAAIGPVRYVVAPNKSHHLFFLPFLQAHPAAQGYVAAGLQAKRPDLRRYAQLPPDPPWGAELAGFHIDGLPILDETVWYHHDTGSLIVTDLLFCFSRANRGLTAGVARLLGVYGRLGMSRTMKLATRDKHALARSVAPLLELPLQRVILAHDQIVDTRPGEQLAQALAWLR
jgi:hypothetical protein